MSIQLSLQACCGCVRLGCCLKFAEGFVSPGSPLEEKRGLVENKARRDCQREQIDLLPIVQSNLYSSLTP